MCTLPCSWQLAPNPPEANFCQLSLLPPNKSLLFSHKSPRGERESHIDGSRDKAAEDNVLQGSYSVVNLNFYHRDKNFVHIKESEPDIWIVT